MAVAAKEITISPPNFRIIQIWIIGTAPYVQARFSEKARQKMRKGMELGSASRKGTKREPRDFDADFKGAMHVSEDGWIGMPAAAFRNACIDACRMVGFQMTRAKMSIFIKADGIDALDGSPLIKIEGPEPEKHEMITRNATGVPDIRVRPMWRKWGAKLNVEFDADQFTESDVMNLLARAGVQVGVGEGRPFSKDSNGLGWGTFEIRGPE